MFSPPCGVEGTNQIKYYAESYMGGAVGLSASPCSNRALKARK